MKHKFNILRLRKEGKSYNEISNILHCAKSTVSFHCRKYNLSKPTIKIGGNEHLLLAKRSLKQQKIEKYKLEATSISKQFDYKDWYMIGLYQGEGSKYNEYDVYMSNSNPNVIKSWLAFLIKLMSILGISRDIKLDLHSHIARKDIEDKLVDYWETLTGLRVRCVVYDKRSKQKTIHNENYKGCVKLGIGSLKCKTVIDTLMDICS